MNRTVIIGRLVENPKRMNDNNVVFTISNATIKDGNEVMNFHNILTFGKQAGLAMQHLHKKDLCCIEGSLTKTESGGVAIRAMHITFLSSKK